MQPIVLSRAALLRPGASQHVRLYVGDALSRLREMPDESIHCAITSPPYYGLRNYKIDGQLGLEPTPTEYVEKLVEILRELRRVLRDDGVLWLNLGDGYCAPSGGLKMDAPSIWAGKQANRHPHATSAIRAHIDYQCKPKDLLGIPWTVALALRADGWYLRSEVIWHKPNPMVESTSDRPTRAHEQLFMLSKAATYYYDQVAIAEPGVVPGSTRNKRTVWTVSTEPVPSAHFATFPQALVEPCILAGTSEKGVCSACGAPWQRLVAPRARSANVDAPIPAAVTLGWEPGCTCGAAIAPAVLLDPFAGSGTVGLVADRLGRDAILIELNPEYVEIARQRLLLA